MFLEQIVKWHSKMFGVYVNESTKEFILELPIVEIMYYGKKVLTIFSVVYCSLFFCCHFLLSECFYFWNMIKAGNFEF